MPEPETTQILVAIARVEEQTKAIADRVAEFGDHTTTRLNDHSKRLDKLERIAYVALGIAVASGAPQVASLIH